MGKAPPNTATRSKVSSKGQVTIPADVRLAAGIKPGTDVVFTALSDGRIVLRAKTASAVDLKRIAKSTSVRASDAQIRNMVVHRDLKPSNIIGSAAGSVLNQKRGKAAPEKAAGVKAALKSSAQKK